MKRYLNFVAALTLANMLGSFAVAQSQSDEAVTDAKRAGMISGRVVNDSGQPLANASVTVRAYGNGAPVHDATTDIDGRFRVGGLDPLLYLVSAYLPAYVSPLRDPDSTPIGYFRVGDSVRLELIKGGVVTGAVTGANGEPIVAVEVSVSMVRDGSGQSPRYDKPVRYGSTDDRGVYRIYGLATGTYVISAGGGENENGYTVNPYGGDTPTYFPSSTRDTANEVSIRSGEETSGIDIRYRGEPGHKVSGTVSNSVALAQPADFIVSLSHVLNGVSQAGYAEYQPSGFSFSGAADGDYYLTARAFLNDGTWVVSEPRRIKVKGADVTGIELTAAPLGAITGRVVLEESKAPECQGKRRLLFGEIVIGAWHNEKNAAKDQPQFVWGLGGPTLPDKQGEFALRNLAPGEYRFNVRAEAKYWYLKSISWPASASARAMPANRSVDAARNWSALKPGARLADLTVTIAEGAASLQGQIDLAEGQKLPPKLFVYLVPAGREKAEDVLRYFASLVLPDGSFGLTNLPPGGYWVLARAAGANESNILSKLRLPDEAEARAKLLRDAEAGKIETEFKPCQNVTDYRLPFR